MSAHLRELPRCRVCGAAATKALHNTWNAEQGVYCAKHATKALRDFQRDYERDAGGVS